MKPVLYVDVYFFINFCFNWICLFITGRILSLTMKIPRFLLSSLLGAAGAVGLLFVAPRWAVLLLHILLSLLICIIGVRHRTVPDFLRFVGLFFLSSVLIGGGMSALMNVMGGFGGGAAELFLYGTVLFFILYTVWQVCGGWVKKRLSTKVADVEIFYEGKKAIFAGLIDSGNLLREPLTGYPVVLIKARGLEGMLCAQTLQILKTGMTNGSTRVLAVPVHSGAEKRMLFGFVPDALFITDGKKGKAAVSAVVAVDDVGDSFAGCQCLLPITLL